MRLINSIDEKITRADALGLNSIINRKTFIDNRNLQVNGCLSVNSLK